MNAKKFATSLPAKQYDELERARKRLRIPRSQIVQEALRMWLSARSGDERISAYIRGYANHPDDTPEAEAIVRAWATGMPEEDWK